MEAADSAETPLPDECDLFVVTDEPLDLARLLAHLTDRRLGGSAVFIGSVRSPNRGHEVAFLDYEGFEPMMLAEMARMAGELRAPTTSSTPHPSPVRIVLAHRLGRVLPGEASMLVAVAAQHRAEALAACTVLVESCKARLPVWKLEVGTSGASRYVDGTATAAPTL